MNCISGRRFCIEILYRVLGKEGKKWDSWLLAEMWRLTGNRKKSIVGTGK
jgi:hypothetical protein